MTLSAVTDNSFPETVLQSPTPVAVFFYAEWCGLCRAMLPAVAETAAAFCDQVRIVGCCVEAAPRVAGHYTVSGVPAVLLFQGGSLQERHDGIMSRETLARHLEPYTQ